MTRVNANVAIVAIGRNEGERLVRCLESLAQHSSHIVYVDSGSTDDSVVAARGLGAAVVELDDSRPYTAARGRNAGFDSLQGSSPDVSLVQFIDGDCELAPGWISAAAAYLELHPDVAAVAGRRRERFPDASSYNQLADMEWDTPVGEADEFGGDVMIRASVFLEVSGYDESLIAGEDPNLSFRIRQAGHRVVRLDEEMTLHDANMHHFREFWSRQVRAGHAYAELAKLHGSQADPARFRSLLSIVAWGGVLPAFVLTLAWFTSGFALGLLVLYPILWLRIVRAELREGRTQRDATLYASSCVVGKFAEMRGVLLFSWVRFVSRKESTLIEYKGAE